TFDEFFAAADALEAAGITPLALGDTGIWAAVHLFENVLLGIAGSDDYIGLMDGSVRWDSDGAKEAIQTFVDLLDHVNDDHSALGWDEAAQYVIDGSAACTVMGDWALRVMGFRSGKITFIYILNSLAPSTRAASFNTSLLSLLSHLNTYILNLYTFSLYDFPYLSD
ncbi:unnamed protein product, partial [marine sediment metagenome]